MAFSAKLAQLVCARPRRVLIFCRMPIAPAITAGYLFLAALRFRGGPVAPGPAFVGQRVPFVGLGELFFSIQDEFISFYLYEESTKACSAWNPK